MHSKLRENELSGSTVDLFPKILAPDKWKITYTEPEKPVASNETIVILESASVAMRRLMNLSGAGE